MIIDMKPIPLVEVREIAGEMEEKKELKDYLKKFTKADKKESKEISEKILALNSLKIKEEHIVKIIDFLPQTPEDLNRIFNDISLDEKEINEILAIVKRN